MLKAQLSSLSTFIPISHPYLSEIRLLLNELAKIQKEAGGKPNLRILDLEKGSQVTHYNPKDVGIVETFMVKWNLYPTRFGISFELERPDFVVNPNGHPKSLYDWYTVNLNQWLADNRPKKLGRPIDSPLFHRFAYGIDKSEEYLELISGPKNVNHPLWLNRLSGNAYVRYDLARQAWELYKSQGVELTLTAMVNTLFGPGAFDEPELAGTLRLSKDGNSRDEADNIERVRMWLEERAAPRIAKLITKDNPGANRRELKRLARVWGNYLQNGITTKLEDQAAEQVDKTGKK